MMNVIFLARHATPDWNRQDLPYHLPPGPPLTAHGVAEAQALGAFFKQAGISRLYTSPLERCHHTAKVAAEICAIPLQVISALTEWQPGEEPALVKARLLPVFETACQDGQQSRPAALVTHGGPVTVLLEALGIDPERLSRLRVYDHGNPLPPAGVWQASRSSARQPWSLDLVFTPGLASVI